MMLGDERKASVGGAGAKQLGCDPASHEGNPAGHAEDAL